MEIEPIRAKIVQGKYSVAFTHTEKLRQRRIEAQDIEEAVRTGNIIEGYPDDPRGASCLILGLVGERPLHVLCGRLMPKRFLSSLPMNRIQRSGKMIGEHARRGDAMSAECYFCKGRVVQEKVKVDFRWGRKLKVIEDVPAGVCQQCGEKYFHSSVYKSMEKLAASRAKPASQLTVDVVRFRMAV